MLLSLLCYCFDFVAAPASLAPNWTKKSLFSSVLLKLSQLQDSSYVGLLNALDGSFSLKSWGSEVSHSATFSFKRPCKGGKSSKTQKIDFWKSIVYLLWAMQSILYHDVYNCGELLILQDLLNKRVPEGRWRFWRLTLMT